MQLIVNCAHDKMVAINTLKPHPKNPNKHPKEQIVRLAEILRYQGFRNPIKVSNLSGYVTAGHGRLEAALLNGYTEVPVDYQDYTDNEQELADLTADNAIALWAELDLAAINEFVPDLGPDFNIDLLGLKDFTIDMSEKEGLTDEDEIPETTKVPKTRLGDLFRLGNHRLLCGVMKPVEMIEVAVKNSSKSQGSVLDLFLGSGSTLIACEKTNRNCYGMELDPHYCDVIIARYEQYTGNKAELIDG